MFTKSSDMQKHPGCKKSAGLIRSSPTYVRPKALISAEAKKSPIKDFSNYLAAFFRTKIIIKGGQVTKPIILVKICYKLLYVIQV